MFLKPIAEAEAQGRVADIYAAQISQMGFVMETAKALSVRPDLLPLYTDFIEALRNNFSLGLRAWRLITLIAARHVPSTYCSLVYGKQLIADLGSKEAVLAVQRDFRNAGLPPAEIAMLAYAEKIATDASKIGQGDIDSLRAAGFTDHQIADIALCAAFRCFISRYFDAVGATPDSVFVDSDRAFTAQLSVGRPV